MENNASSQIKSTFVELEYVTSDSQDTELS